MSMIFLPMCMCVLCPQREEQGISSSENGVTNTWELQYGCWELNLGPLEEPPVLLTS